MRNNEHISALIDGQLQDAKLLKDIESEATLATQWRNYHLIGDAIRGDLASHIDLDITSKVALALEDEPAIIAPQTQASKATFAQLRGRVSKVMRYAGQYAIAASVAVAAIVGVQHYAHDSGDIPAPLPVFDTMPLGGAVTPVGLQQLPQQRELSEAELNEVRRRIGAYLHDHHFQQRVVE